MKKSLIFLSQRYRKVIWCNNNFIRNFISWLLLYRFCKLKKLFVKIEKKLQLYGSY